MEKKNKAVPVVAEVVTKVVALLEPLESQDRQKAIKASLTILGESSQNGHLSGSHTGAHEEDKCHLGEKGADGVNARARIWMKQNAVALEQLEELFDLATGALIGPVPGNSSKEQAKNAYVLVGIGRLLSSGDPSFDDKSARAACQNSGCYDRPNHATTMKAIGNLLTGSKDKGWKLTSPGLRRGAGLIKQARPEA